MASLVFSKFEYPVPELRLEDFDWHEGKQLSNNVSSFIDESLQKLDPSIITSALIDSLVHLFSRGICLLTTLPRHNRETAVGSNNQTTPWLAGLDLSAFPGPTFDRQVAQAARYIHADILSPAAVHSASVVKDPALPGYTPFTTEVSHEELSSFKLVFLP